MNLHLIFIHFPIALLTVYALFECIRFKKILAIQSFETVKTVLLLLGTGGAFIAAATGDSAEHAIALTASLRSLVEIHANWAVATEVIFGILSLVHLARYAEYIKWLSGEKKIHRVFSLGIKYIHRFDRPWLLVSLSLVGLATLTFTGAVGGIIAHGASADLLTQWVANILGQ